MAHAEEEERRERQVFAVARGYRVQAPVRVRGRVAREELGSNAAGPEAPEAVPEAENRTFEVFAVEADPAFHAEYAARKGRVTLLPYAAWVRNDTLAFEINGMGRIRPAEGASESAEVRRVPAFDLAEWMTRTFSEQDYVVVKMDVEGAEFRPRHERMHAPHRGDLPRRRAVP
ncbi:hypothetical protein PR202_ga26029 [Eleusine coracana subsp. coracana]|uniref:FkbM family methyltransferase n=1 Tax=Eleusine coracana subsp. coracana TaxID=191504 RepID=A0AAV5DCZ8_ELECO|nr:hypothetical protein PR202_ga26029 [Eleusine coracana subsp. coracana]